MLYFLRFARSRSAASNLIGAGTVRRNGERITKPSQAIHAGDILTLPLAHGVRLVEVLALPDRRGPPRDAQGCYRVLDPHGQSDIAASPEQPLEGTPDP
ncbi:MAG: S4 domain-containing protein [Sphingomonadaceae bacterium]